MNYDHKIRELEIQVEGLKAKIVLERNNGNSVVDLEKKHASLLESIREYRRLQYTSQFVMNDDDYEY